MRKYIHRLEPQYGTEPRPIQAFDIGNIGHKALEAHYKGYSDAVCHRVARLKAHTDNTYDTEKLFRQDAFDAVDRYLTWSNDTNPDKGLSVVDVEARLYMNLGTIRGDKITLTCEPDVVVTDRFGLYHILDHKFVDQMSKMRNGIDSNPQGLTYGIVGTQHYGTAITSFTLNMVNRKPTKTKAFITADRATQYLDPDKLARWEVYLRRIITDMVQLWQEVESGDESGAYPHSDWTCNMKCNMKDICCQGITQDPATIADLIRVNYRTKQDTL